MGTPSTMPIRIMRNASIKIMRLLIDQISYHVHVFTPTLKQTIFLHHSDSHLDNLWGTLHLFV